MSWRVAKSLLTLRGQINQSYPSRRKASDGTIGDTRHCPGSSDHCPKPLDGPSAEVVTAMDITHDPSSGCDAQSIVDALVASRDSRIKYIIWNRQIISSTRNPWKWRSYSGANPHTKHFHLSVSSSKAEFDSTTAWTIGNSVAPNPPPNAAPYRVVARRGLRLREGPGTQFDIIGRLSPNDIVFVTGTDGDWYEVDRNGDGLKDGFSFGAFLVKI
jgi:hypothetical protein